MQALTIGNKIQAKIVAVHRTMFPQLFRLEHTKNDSHLGVNVAREIIEK